MVLTYSDRIPRAPPYSLLPEILSFRLQDYHLVLSIFPNNSTMIIFCNSYGSGLFPVQSPLLRESLLLSFPSDTWMFRFSESRSSLTMYSLTGTNSSNWWVAPFGYLRIFVYLQLPVAFRCSSRPSSPSSAKASTVHSFFLNLTFFSFYFRLLLFNFQRSITEKLSRSFRTKQEN